MMITLEKKASVLGTIDAMAHEYGVSTRHVTDVFIKHYWAERNRLNIENSIDLQTLVSKNKAEYIIYIKQVHEYAIEHTREELKNDYKNNRLHPMDWG